MISIKENMDLTLSAESMYKSENSEGYLFGDASPSLFGITAKTNVPHHLGDYKGVEAPR